MRKFLILFVTFLLSGIILTWCKSQENSENISENNPTYCEDGITCSLDKTNANVQDKEEMINNEIPSEEPEMRKMVVNENETPEEIEKYMTEACENAWWNWEDWECILEDGSKIMF